MIPMYTILCQMLILYANNIYATRRALCVHPLNKYYGVPVHNFELKIS